MKSKSLKNILVIVIAVFAVRCSKKLCTTPPSPVPIRLVSSNGTDLLNPSLPGSYSLSDIQLSYIVNGSTKVLPLSLQKFTGTDSFFLATDIGWYSDRGQTFFLKLSNSDTDTLYVRVDQVSNNDCTYFESKEFRYNSRLITPIGIVAGYPYIYQIEK